MKKFKDRVVRTRVDKEFYEKYWAYCKKNSFVYSKRLRVLMEKDLRGEIK